MSATVAVTTAVGTKVAGAAFEHALKMLADLPSGDSLVGYAQAGNVEPTALVDEDARGSDLLPNVLQLAQSVYGAYYLRAFSMHNISIGNASVLSRLDKFSTRRSPVTAGWSNIAGIASAGLEEFDDRLIVDGEIRELPSEIKELEDTIKKDAEEAAKWHTAMEAQGMNTYSVKGQQATGKNTPSSSYATNMQVAAAAGVNKALASDASTTIGKTIDIGEPVNLGSGRMINVTIKDNGREVTVPVLIRLNAVYMATAPLLHILTASAQDVNFGPRFRKWRMGGIDFWRDLVFCQDLIDAHKTNLRADKSGVYLQMMQKRRQNTIAAAVSASMSANNASNIIIMTQASADALEMKIFGKLKDFNTRQKIFKQGFGMLMFIIDKQWGRVRMYTRDIPEYTELNAADLKGAAKDGGVDIGDVLNAFRAGSSPRL